VASGERRVRQQGEELECLKAECGALRGRLERVSGQLGATPERCRAAQQTLEGDAERWVGLGWVGGWAGRWLGGWGDELAV